MIRKFSAASVLLPLSLLAGTAWSTDMSGGVESVLANFEKEIEANPEYYLERFERANYLLDMGLTRQPAGEDIDTLLTKPEWHESGLRLRALHLYLQGRHSEAAIVARANIKANNLGPEQFRLLAGIALAHKDTAAAIRAYHEGWERLRLEEDYFTVVDLSAGRKGVPDPLLQEGLAGHPKSPGVHALIFSAYMAKGDAAALARAREISENGQSLLWPRSIDWKIRHARALIASGMGDSAQPVLARAQALQERDARLKGNSEAAVKVRNEISGLLDSARAKR
jgi:hypothetical protein